MTADEVIAALELPAAARVERRVPKTLLVEHGAPSTADKRLINDGIEQIQWVAALKPGTIGVAAYRDEVREYLEIAVLRMTLRPAARAARLVELLHRAVPYPVLAVVESDEQASLSLAHIRRSQGEADRMVLDGGPVTQDTPGTADPLRAAFAAALPLGAQPRGSMLAVYQGWMDVLHTLQAARVTGRFVIPTEAERRTARREALQECVRLDAEITRLRAAAGRETQMARQVDLNLELKRVEAARAAALARL